MDNKNEKLVKQISILQKVSLGIVILYFAAKYIFKMEQTTSFFLIIPLVSVVFYRSFLEYKLTGNKTKLMLLTGVLLVAAGIAGYFYLYA